MHKLINSKFIPAFTKALVLAVLMNLSGHMFLHLGDANLEQEGAHISAHSEAKSVNAPAHQCSVCQDHQTLTLEQPATEPIFIFEQAQFESRGQAVQINSFIALSHPTRGPPLS